MELEGSLPAKEKSSTAVPAWAYLVLIAAVIALFWLPRLFRGMWVDETAVFWIVKDGIAGVWPKQQVLSEQSIIYSYLSAIFFVDGPYKEFSLRIPCVLFALWGAYQLYRLTERFLGAGTGFLAVVPFCCSGTIIETVTNARPYAVSFPFVLLSFMSLRDWVHARRPSAFWTYCLVSPFLVYFHYLFGLVFVVQLLYLLVAARYARDFSWKPVFAAAALILLTAIPVVRPLLTIAGNKASWKTTVIPELTQLLGFYPTHALLATLFALFLFRVLYPKWFAQRTWIPKDDLFLLLSWMLIGPVALFAVQRYLGYSIFAARYAIYAILPFFILLAWGIQQVSNPRARFAVLAAISLNTGMYVHQLDWTEWRTPLSVASQMAGPDTPLLVRTGFFHTPDIDLKGEPRPSSPLFAPLTAYPVPNEVIPVPYFVYERAQKTIEREILSREASHQRFCLVANEKSDILEMLPPWFDRRGYKATAVDVSGFKVVLFERKIKT